MAKRSEGSNGMQRIIRILIIVIFCLCLAIFVGRMLEVGRLNRRADELREQNEASAAGNSGQSAAD